MIYKVGIFSRRKVMLEELCALDQVVAVRDYFPLAFIQRMAMRN